MEAIKKLFEYNNIRYIVSVDDCYDSVQVDEILLIEDIVSNLWKYEEIISQIDWIDNFDSLKSLPTELFKRKLEEYFQEINQEIKDKLMSNFDSKESILLDEKKLLLDFFGKLKDEGIIEEYRTFKGIDQAKKFLENDINADWRPTEKNKVLWFIDREIAEKKDAGFELLKILCSDKYEYNIGVLATQNISDIANEDEFDNKLNELLDLPKDNKNLVWVIEKTLIDTNTIDEFVEEISHGLRRNYTYQITNHLIKSISDGLIESSTSFKSIKQSTINNIILKYSTSEGTSMIDTLTRVLMAITKSEMNKKICTNFDEISGILDKYEKLCEDLNRESIENLQDVYGFRNNEKYNMLVNELYYPIGFGDIFKIKDEKYILISQPCDIQIRGDKGQRNLKYATLLQVTNDKPNHDSYTILEYYKKGERYFVSYKDTLSLEFTILDLCSLNHDGVAKGNINLLGKPLNKAYRYTTGQRKMLNEVLTQVDRIFKQEEMIKKQYEEIKNAMTSLSDGNIVKTLEEYHREIISAYTEELGLNSYIIEENFIKYPVERECRLEEIYATKLMLDYGAYISRIGLPGDYALTYKYTKFRVLMPLPKQFILKGNSEMFLDKNTDILDTFIEKDGKKIRKYLFEELIEDNYNEVLETKINNDLKRFMDVDMESKEVTLSWKYIVFEGREFIDINKDEVLFKTDLISDKAPKFYEFLIYLEGKETLINEYGLLNYYDRQYKLKPKISINMDLFEEQNYVISIDDTNLLKINVTLDTDIIYCEKDGESQEIQVLKLVTTFIEDPIELEKIIYSTKGI